MLFETEVVACICHSPLHHQKPDFEGQSVIKASSYLLPFVLEAHRESLPRSCETSARRLSAESAEVYSTADLSASAAHIPFSDLSASAAHIPFSSFPSQGVPIQVKLNLKRKLFPPPLRSRGVLGFIVGFPPTRPSPLNTLEV